MRSDRWTADKPLNPDPWGRTLENGRPGSNQNGDSIPIGALPTYRRTEQSIGTFRRERFTAFATDRTDTGRPLLASQLRTQGKGAGIGASEAPGKPVAALLNDWSSAIAAGRRRMPVSYPSSAAILAAYLDKLPCPAFLEDAPDRRTRRDGSVTVLAMQFHGLRIACSLIAKHIIRNAEDLLNAAQPRS